MQSFSYLPEKETNPIFGVILSVNFLKTLKGDVD